MPWSSLLIGPVLIESTLLRLMLFSDFLDDDWLPQFLSWKERMGQPAFYVLETKRDMSYWFSLWDGHKL